MLPGKIYTPDVVLEVAWRHRWKILLPFVLATAIVVPYSHMLPDLYRAETLILVVPQRIPETYVRATVSSRIEERLRSMNEQILSRTRLEPVILEFDLYADQRMRRPMEEVVELMRLDVAVQPVRNDSFRVAYTARHPVTAAKVANRLAALFIEEDQRSRAVLAEDTNEFLESELASAKARLVDHERKLEDFRLRYAGQLPQQFQSNLQVIQSTQEQSQSIAESINRDRDRRLLLEKSLNDAESADYASGSGRTPSAPGTLPEVIPSGDRSLDALDTARAELRQMEQRLKPTHPDVIEKKRQVQQLEAQVARESTVQTPGEPARPLNTAELIRRSRMRQIQTEIDKVDAQIATKEKEARRLQEVIDEYRKRVEAVPTRETELTELMRDYETVNKIYLGLLAKKEDANIAVNLERKQIGEQFKILDAATPAERPFSPDRLRMNVAGSFAGLILGLTLAALLEYRDTSLRIEHDVVRVLSLPVLAVIPFMESPRERRNRRLRLALTCFAALLGVAAAAAVVAKKYGWIDWPI